MEGSVSREPAQPAATGGRGRDFRLVLLLLVLAGGIRAWVVCRTEVISRDCIIFIDYALQFERRPWNEVLRTNHQHPGYPLSLLAVSVPVRHWLGTTPAAMQLSAQLAGALPGVLLVIPMFFLGTELMGRRAAFWGTILFQCLPVSGRILSDGLSEPLFLLLVTTALWLAVRGLRSPSAWRFLGCGLFSGLAYLTRPEGAVVVVAAGLFFLVHALVPSWRRGWRWTLRSGASVVVPALVVGGPYVLVIHHLTNKPSENIVKPVRRQAAAPAQVGGFPAPPLAIWINQDLRGIQRLRTGLAGVVGETVKGLHFFALPPALLGLWWHRKRLRARPEAWLVVILCLVHAAVLWRLAVVAGYVSERHVLLLVLCACCPAVVGMWELPGRLAEWWRCRSVAGRGRWALLAGNPRAWSVFLVLALIGSGLPKTLQSLHANRAGHHAAGAWLARHSRATDEVLDGHFGWAHFYAGRFSTASQIPPHPAGAARTVYVVKGHSLERENPYGPTNALADMTVADIHAAHGRIVYHWPERSPVDRADVVIWRVHLGGTR
jgi:hypothetical protein